MDFDRVIAEVVAEQRRSLRVEWNMPLFGGWRKFMTLDTSPEKWGNPFGVYVIAQGTYEPTTTVRVGQGVVMARNAEHQCDEEILGVATGELFVTWAEVPQAYAGGVERYLAETLHPLVGKRFPDVPPIEVNLPPPLKSTQEKLVAVLMKRHMRSIGAAAAR